jgi:hypothetical protein
MAQQKTTSSTVDDPRKLTTLLARVAELAQVHSVGSVIVGMAAPLGDLAATEFADFLSSALRVEDGIFRMTRERAVIHLADAEMEKGRTIFNRILEDFVEEFPSAKEPQIQVNYLEVVPGTEEVRTKDVLTKVFPPRMLH